MVMAVSALAPVRHANADAMMLPSTMSAGTAAPTLTRPMLTSSAAAPTARPVIGSPRTTPTSVAPTSGCSKFRRPSRRESSMQNTLTRPTSRALTNVFMSFSFRGLRRGYSLFVTSVRGSVGVCCT